jgi:hypothetical protein
MLPELKKEIRKICPQLGNLTKQLNTIITDVIQQNFMFKNNNHGCGQEN